MRIAIDSWTLSSRFRYCGTYVYAWHLVAQFREIAKTRPDLEFCLFNSRDDGNDAGLLAPATGFELRATRLLDHHRAWRIGGGNAAAASVHADLMFSPTASIVPLGSVPVACTSHDASAVLAPFQSRRQALVTRSFMWLSAKLSRAVITVSQCSKRDLVRLYGLPDSKISVIYNGYDRTTFNPVVPDPALQEALLARLGIRKPYLLHHGVIQPRKNLVRLIEAYRLVLSRKRDLDLDLVLAGPLGWRYDDVLAAAADAAGSRGRVVLTGALTDSDLSLLIKGALLAVIPSLYEGFGLPMVEAMACGTPTIASANSCLPEVSGNALRYFDPLSLDDIARQMETAILDSGVREQLRRDGMQRAGVFSWERCAWETLEVLLAVEKSSRGKRSAHQRVAV